VISREPFRLSIHGGLQAAPPRSHQDGTCALRKIAVGWTPGELRLGTPERRSPRCVGDRLTGVRRNESRAGLAPSPGPECHVPVQPFTGEKAASSKLPETPETRFLLNVQGWLESAMGVGGHVMVEEQTQARVLIVEDQALFAEAVRGALEYQGMTGVGMVSTGEEAMVAVETLHPKVVLMDLALPGQSGLAVGRAILERWPEVKIVALTALNDKSILEEALRVGFVGYLTKDVSIAQLANSIRAVADGNVLLPHKLWPRRSTTYEDDAALLASQLSPREREVLALLVEGAGGETVSRKLGISRNTVRTHVQNILTKLQVHSRLEAATFAVRHRVVPLADDRRRLLGS
jgi:two-component system, NarL family, nitrate/nitrite response regulator NarL